jgi:hypothetical protein
MTSRERLRTAIRHQQHDRAPRDLGSTPVTDIQATVPTENMLALLKVVP